MRRVASVLVGAAILLSAVAVSGPAHAAPVRRVLVPSATTVAVGDTLTVAQLGCSQDPSPSAEGSTHAEVSIVNGTGDRARVIAVGSVNEPLAIPGWVDRSRTTFLTGLCIREVWSDQAASQPRQTVLFRFPDVPLRITRASRPPVTPRARLSRSTAAGGQVVQVSVSGCPADARAVVGLVPGRTLNGRHPVETVSLASAPKPARRFVLDLPLNDVGAYAHGGANIADTPSGGPLPAGVYTVFALCVGSTGGGDEESPTWFAPSQPIVIEGSNPSGAVTAVVARAPHSLDVSGSGCSGGRVVTATFTGWAGDPSESPVTDRSVPFAQTRVAPDMTGEIKEVLRAAPSADGVWSLSWSSPKAGYYVMVSVDCGSAAGAGFRYVPRFVQVDRFAHVEVSRLSPTSAAPRDQVMVHLSGECTGMASASLSDSRGKALSSGPITGSLADGSARASLVAPSAPGRYTVQGVCDGKLGYAGEFTVFTPTTLADPAPLEPTPTIGWPVQGKAAVYHGRIGPITLPALADDAMGEAMDSRAAEMMTSTTVLPTTPPLGMSPSGYGVAVPRPAGDFAIKAMTFDLVDAAGKPIPHDVAHLHHFVIGNLSSKNPACPTGTFGLPGEIVGATGAERTAVDFGPGPYGLKVKGSDKWSGVYEVMNRTPKARTVYLSYTFTIRRDVTNIRPLRNYFGSATGCSSFTWKLDGSKVPDTQSTYVSVASDGVLVGGGGHLHNGGKDTLLADDRGRALCRSTLQVGTAPMVHEDGPSMPEAATTTAPAVLEMYPEDPPILGINTCRMFERVRKGERLRFDATYLNDRPRRGVMGIFSFYVWEGGGPAWGGPRVRP